MSYSSPEEQHILDETLAAGVAATDSHRSLARLGVDQVWTTNCDPLIERADPTALVISSDDDVRLIGPHARPLSRCTAASTPRDQCLNGFKGS